MRIYLFRFVSLLIFIISLGWASSIHAQNATSTAPTAFAVETKWLDSKSSLQLTFVNLPPFENGQVEVSQPGATAGALYRFTNKDVIDNLLTLPNGFVDPITDYEIRVELVSVVNEVKTRTEAFDTIRTGTLSGTPTQTYTPTLTPSATFTPSATPTPRPTNTLQPVVLGFSLASDGSANVYIAQTPSQPISQLEVSVYNGRLPTAFISPTGTPSADSTVNSDILSLQATLYKTYTPVWQSTFVPSGTLSQQVFGLVPGEQYYLYAQAFDTQQQVLGTGLYYVGNPVYNPRPIDYITYFLFRTPQGIFFSLAIVAFTSAIGFYIVRRQQRWLAVAGYGRFAFVSPLRKRVVKLQANLLRQMNYDQFNSVLAERGTSKFKAGNWYEQLQMLNTSKQDRSLVNKYSLLIMDLYKALPVNQRKPEDAYDNTLIEETARQIRKHFDPLEKRYWALEDNLAALKQRLKLLPVESPETLSTNIQQNITLMAQELSTWQNEINGYGDFLSQQDQVVVGTIANIATSSTALSRRDVREEANDILTELANLRNQVSQAQTVYPEKLNAVVLNTPPYPLITVTSHFTAMRNVLEYLQNFIYEIENRVRNFFIFVDNKLTTVLESLLTLENVAKLDERLEDLPRSGLAPLTARVIAQLRSIEQEVRLSNSLALHSYPQRRAISEAYIKSNRLIAQLEAEGTPISHEWVTHIRRINQLFEEQQPDIASLENKLYTNPYVPGAPISVSAVALFKGRRDVIERINIALRSGGKPTILIYGPRRMGKSSLLAHLPNDLLPPEYISIYFDAQGASQNEQSFFFGLATNIHAVMQDRSRRDIPTPLIKDYTQVPFTVFEDWLRRYISPLIQNQKLFVTIDEFEKIGEAIRQTEQIDHEIRMNLRDPETRPKNAMTRAMLDHLRNIIQHKDEIVLLFSGVQTLEALAPNAANYFLQVESIELSYLDEAAAKELVLEPVPVDFGRVPKYENDALEEILHLSNRQPFLIQAMCSALVDIANEHELESITLAQVNKVSNLVQKKFAFYFEEIWDSVDVPGQQFLVEIVRNNGQIDNGEHKSVVVENLIRRHILRQTDTGYAFEIPLIRVWIAAEKLGSTGNNES